MTAIRTINAIFQKQIKDTLKNLQVLVLFIVYPAVGFILSSSMPAGMGEKSFFISIFATMHVIFTPLVVGATIVSEDKEKNTLRMLIMSNVKPYQYLLSVGGFVFLGTIITGLSFLAMHSYTVEEMLKIILFMGIGSVCSVIAGLTAGGYAKNMASASALSIPAGLLFSFIPMISYFNENIKKVSQFTFGQQISDMICEPGSAITIKGMGIIGVNLLIVILIFAAVFKLNKLDN